MADIPDLFQARWRTGKHVGAAKPFLAAWIRTGRYDRAYSAWEGPGINAIIPGSSMNKPWQATWTPYSDWIPLPGVLSFDPEQDFEQNGITVGNIVIENVALVDAVGATGLYRLIERGLLSPWRGYRPPSRPAFPGVKNQWYEKLVSNAQVRVSQGYGDAVTETFVGLIDQVAPTPRPQQVRLILRDHGQMTTDQRLFGWSKDRRLDDPVTFEQGITAKKKSVGHGAKASSYRPGYPPSFVTDGESSTRWLSSTHGTPNVTEWVEIRLPKGRYETYLLHPAYAGMEMYLGVFARGKSKMDGQKLPEGFISMGEGVVPGANGGWPYIVHHQSISDRFMSRSFPGKLDLDDDCVVRVAFRNLKEVNDGGHRAGVVQLEAVRRYDTVIKNPRRRVLVKDWSDVVRLVLMWAGFKEWEVEDLGITLADEPLVFGRETFLIDIIKKIQELSGYVFFIGDPTGPNSIGVPIFRNSRAIADMQPSLTVRDTDLLLGFDPQISDEPMPSIIRVRGKSSDRGMTLGGDKSKKIMAVYRPPWASMERTQQERDRHAGIIRHVIHENKLFARQKEVEVMARMIALQSALAGVTANMEIPGHPGPELDSQVFLKDTSTGFATRFYIARRSSSHITGQQASWKTVLGGALMDTPDVIETIADLREALR